MDEPQANRAEAVLLSLCIPTYNRAAYLVVLLDSIFGQLRPGIEIIVSDNASTDNTLDVLAAYAQRFPRFRYQRNEKNLGARDNYMCAGTMARGEYLWFIGSDDEIYPGGIDAVLRQLDAHRNIGGLFLNYSFHDMEMKYIGPSLWTSGKQGSLIWNDTRSAFPDLFHSAGFVSINVIRRDLWLAARENTPWRDFTFLPPLLMHGYAILNSDRWGLVGDLCLKYRSGSPEVLEVLGGDTYARVMREVDEGRNILRWLTNGDRSLRYRTERNGTRLYQRVLILDNIMLGMSGANRLKLLGELTQRFWPYPEFWLKTAPSFLIAPGVIRFYRRMKRHVSGTLRRLSS